MASFFSFSLSDINPICRLLTNIISVYLHKCMSRSTNSGSNNISFYVPIVPSSCSAVNFTFNSTIKYLSYYSIWARSRVALVASRNERKGYNNISVSVRNTYVFTFNTRALGGLLFTTSS